MTTTTTETPRVRHKTFQYTTNVIWLGNRAGLSGSPGKDAFRIASPPEFKGEPGVWTPEDLFVAAVNTCTMTTFLAFSIKREIPLKSYESTAEGTLEFIDGSYRFSRVVIRPRVIVSSPARRETIEQILHDAHKSCLISNSIRGEVSIEAEIVIE